MFFVLAGSSRRLKGLRVVGDSLKRYFDSSSVVGFFKNIFGDVVEVVIPEKGIGVIEGLVSCTLSLRET